MQAFFHILSVKLHLRVKGLDAPEFSEVRRKLRRFLPQSVRQQLGVQCRLLRGDDCLYAHLSVHGQKFNAAYGALDVALAHAALCFLGYDYLIGGDM